LQSLKNCQLLAWRHAVGAKGRKRRLIGNDEITCGNVNSDVSEYKTISDNCSLGLARSTALRTKEASLLKTYFLLAATLVFWFSPCRGQTRNIAAATKVN
jgi:hypothetical protein